jgi:hypothetical protein
MEKKDILRYFIDYCKDSDIFNASNFNRITDKGVVITNEDKDFEIPVDNIYLISSAVTFNKLLSSYNPEDFEQIEIDNGFQNPGLTQLETALGNDYSTINQNGFVEVVSGTNSKFTNYNEFFSSGIDSKGQPLLPYEVFNMILERGIVINYDERYNNIIISSVETWLKYAEAAQISLSNLKYSVTGDVVIGPIVPPGEKAV